METGFLCGGSLCGRSGMGDAFAAAARPLLGETMFDDLLPSGDPLRYIDPRYEPLDPLFDLDEPDLPPMVPGKRRARGVAEADPKARPME